MPTRTQWARSWTIAVLAVAALGCEEEKPKAAPKRAVPSAVTPAPSAAPVESAAPAAPAAPVLSAKCPKESSGEGTYNSPCEAKGASRMMEVTWNNKIDDKGPIFRVINKSPEVILHGKVVVYFYDKAGKQLEIPAPAGSSGKAKPYQTCSGAIFGGIMKPAEKAFFNFSCVKKTHVPEGTTAIEAEMQMVGFADASEKAVDYYWRNAELTPDERKKGGIKAKK
jgi:hypothetical protein